MQYAWKTLRHTTATVGKADVSIIQLMMVEFHLAASVSGGWFCAC